MDPKFLHCQVCNSHRRYKKHQDHKCNGSRLSVDNFFPCPGEDCNRCQCFNNNRAEGKSLNNIYFLYNYSLSIHWRMLGANLLHSPKG